MSPDPRDRRKQRKPQGKRPAVRVRPSPDDPQRSSTSNGHRADDPQASGPGREALNSYPTKVRATMRAVLVAVAGAPSMRFAGGGHWEAMKGDMTGWFELRVDGPGRHYYRLFCLLDYEAHGHDKPLLVVIDGRDKPFRTTLSDGDYAAVRSLGDEDRRRNPRSLA